MLESRTDEQRGVRSLVGEGCMLNSCIDGFSGQITFEYNQTYRKAHCVKCLPPAPEDLSLIEFDSWNPHLKKKKIKYLPHPHPPNLGAVVRSEDNFQELIFSFYCVG